MGLGEAGVSVQDRRRNPRRLGPDRSTPGRGPVGTRRPRVDVRPAGPMSGAWTGWARTPPRWPAGRSGSAGRRSGRSIATIASSRLRKSARMSADSDGLHSGGSMSWWRPASGGGLSSRFLLIIS